MNDNLSEVRGGSGAMFDRIAKRYDTLNRIISLGVDQRWRDRTVDSIEPRANTRILDLATGTADLALRIAKRHSSIEVVGVDPSTEMLAEGRRKVAKQRANVTLIEGRAEELPFEDDHFDGVTIAFGIRNAEDRPKALSEMARVTKPGGRVAVLELSEPESGALGPLARLHIREVVPRVGALLSGSAEYRYLQRSIADFPRPRDFAKQMSDAGLRVLRVLPLTFGVCQLYVAEPAAPPAA